MAEKKKENGEIEIFFFLSRKTDPTGKEFTIYGSEKYRLTDYDILSAIKILLGDRRLVSVGRKLLWVYEDTHNYSEEAYKKLKEKGIDIDRNSSKIVSEKDTKFFMGGM